MTTPLLSIIIPCYNQGQYLAESIRSVLGSAYTDIEIIVVDDGSTDPETCQILDALGYPKARLIRRKNGGLAAARNTGITGAKGKYILPLDADDRIGPAYIGQAVAALEANPDVGIVYCRAEKFGAEAGPWRLAPFSDWRMRLGNSIFCSAVYRRTDWLAVGGYDETLRRGWEDWDFWISLLELGRLVIRLSDVGFYYRKSPASMAAGMPPELKIRLHKRLMEKHPTFFGQWGFLLQFVLPVYYHLAASSLYRGIKKGLGR
jgi:glycosyltransferase involved in cell wall biosynthesis